MKNIKKTALLLGVIMLLSVFSGCGPEETNNDGSRPQISMWMNLHPLVSYSYTNFGDTKIAKELEKRLDMDIKFIHPTQGQEKEQFNLMLTSKDLPDIIFTLPSNFKGGVAQAIDEGIIIPLDDYINEKYAPNLTKLLKEDSDVDKSIKLDDGRYCGFPAAARDKFLRTFKGLIIRQDWLDKLGLPMPETIEEWEKTLTAFKNELNVPIPYTLLGTIEFVSAYNTSRSFYYDINKKAITFGPIEPQYKDFVALMRKWYSEGLLDSEFATQSAEMADAKITNGESGVISAAAASGINKYVVAMSDVEGVKWAGAPYPVLNKGDKPIYGQLSEKAMAQFFITSACKDIEAAVRFLDYGFSEEGHMLYNFGIEGESYTMEDGYPRYTENIRNNKDGVPMNNMLANYVMSVYGGPFVQDKRYFEQYLQRDEQKEAIERWSQVEYSYDLPSLMLTSEEGASILTALTDINTYWTEAEYKFIMGKTDMKEFDSAVQKLHNMGIDDVLKVYNDAYKRRNSR